MSAAPNTAPAVPPFTPYQKLVTALLAFLQFAVVLDFMIMSPLGAMIMPALTISPKQFALAVSAYAFAAGTAGILVAGIADRYDRKRLLLFFYAGFLVGTLWCGFAQSYESLLTARIVTGLFGGVIGSVSMAIVTDLFPPESRGRVLGLMQTAFAASQVLGLPAGLYISNHWDWHAPFFVMAALGVAGGMVVAARMRPVDAHLALKQERSALGHLLHTVAEPRFTLAFVATALLATGGFMLMPFGSAYTVNNLGISLDHLPTIYLVTGICTIVFGPLIGRAADSIGKLRVFIFGSIVSIATVLTYTRLGTTPLAVVIGINIVMFVGIFSRMIPFQAMVAGVPEPAKRGSFNAISAAIQQLSGGLASVIAGHVVMQQPGGKLQHMDVVGDVVVGTTLLSVWLAWRIQRQVTARVGAPSAPQ